MQSPFCLASFAVGPPSKGESNAETLRSVLLFVKKVKGRWNWRLHVEMNGPSNRGGTFSRAATKASLEGILRGVSSEGSFGGSALVYGPVLRLDLDPLFPNASPLQGLFLLLDILFIVDAFQSLPEF